MGTGFFPVALRYQPKPCTYAVNVKVIAPNLAPALSTLFAVYGACVHK